LHLLQQLVLLKVTQLEVSGLYYQHTRNIQPSMCNDGWCYCQRYWHAPKWSWKWYIHHLL